MKVVNAAGFFFFFFFSSFNDGIYFFILFFFISPFPFSFSTVLTFFQARTDGTDPANPKNRDTPVTSAFSLQQNKKKRIKKKKKKKKTKFQQIK